MSAHHPISEFFNVVSSGSDWRHFLESLPALPGEGYARPWYVDAHAALVGGHARAALFEGENGMRMVYPFVLRPIPERLGIEEPGTDLESAYGYGSPLTSHVTSADRSRFQARFADWCGQSGVVAEFVRFHPLLEHKHILGDTLACRFNRDTVTIDLRSGWDRLWAAARPAKRRSFAQAERNGFRLRFTQDISGFARLYHDTMDRVRAQPFYRFPATYFQSLAMRLDQDLLLAEAVDPHGRVGASALFLLDRVAFSYHLGASDPIIMAGSPMVFLILSMARWAVDKGRSWLYLGGGSTARTDDTLLRFKAGFSPLRHPFITGMRKHRPDRHRTLIDAWERRTGRQANRLLSYHDIT